MVEVCSEHGATVFVDGYVTPDRAPQSHAKYGNNKLLLAFDITDIQSQTAVLVVSTAQFETSVLAAFSALLHNVAFGVYYGIGVNDLFIFLRTLRIAEVAYVEGSQHLLLLVESHIDILRRLQRRTDECQQKGYYDHHNATIHYYI